MLESISKPNPDTVTKIMAMVDEWESTDKSSFITEILSNYCDEFIVECVYQDMKKRQNA